jgi:pimeloyl-ACP methyl ester carboxylesterase
MPLRASDLIIWRPWQDSNLHLTDQKSLHHRPPVLRSGAWWNDCDGNLERVYTKDELLTNVMLYWLNGPTARWVSYREEFTAPSLAPDQKVGIPSALAAPPKDPGAIPPRELAERYLTDLRRYTVLPRGGHFVAMEYPDVMAADVRRSSPS